MRYPKFNKNKSINDNIKLYEYYNVFSNEHLRSFLRDNRLYYIMYKYNMVPTTNNDNDAKNLFDYMDPEYIQKYFHFILAYNNFRECKYVPHNTLPFKRVIDEDITYFINKIERENRIEFTLKYYDKEYYKKLSYKDQLNLMIDKIYKFNKVFFTSLSSNERYKDSKLFTLNDNSYLPIRPCYKINILYKVDFKLNVYLKNKIKILNNRKEFEVPVSYILTYPILIYPDLNKIIIVRLNKFNNIVNDNSELYTIKEFNIDELDRVIDYINILSKRQKENISNRYKRYYDFDKYINRLARDREINILLNGYSKVKAWNKLDKVWNCYFRIKNYNDLIDTYSKRRDNRTLGKLFVADISVFSSDIDRIEINSIKNNFYKVDSCIYCSNLLINKAIIKDKEFIDINKVATNFDLIDDKYFHIRSNNNFNYTSNEIIQLLIDKESSFNNNFTKIIKSNNIIIDEIENDYKEYFNTINKLIANNKDIENKKKELCYIIDNIVKYDNIVKAIHSSFKGKIKDKYVKLNNSIDEAIKINYIVHNYCTYNLTYSDERLEFLFSINIEDNYKDRNTLNYYNKLLVYSLHKKYYNIWFNKSYFFNENNDAIVVNYYDDDYIRREYNISSFLKNLYNFKIVINNNLLNLLDDHLYNIYYKLHTLYDKNKDVKKIINDISDIVTYNILLNKDVTKIVNKIKEEKNSLYTEEDYMRMNIESFKKLYPYTEEEILNKSLDELFGEIYYYFTIKEKLNYERTL